MKFHFIICLFIFLPFTPIASSAEPKIITNFKCGVVDIAYVLNNSVALSSTKSQIRAINKDLRIKTEKKELDFKAKERSLMDVKGKIPQEEFVREVHKFNKELSFFQESVKKDKNKLERFNSDSFSRVHQEILDIVEQIAIDMDLAIVIPSSQILYTTASLNITQDVTRLLNQKLTFIEIRWDDD